MQSRRFVAVPALVLLATSLGGASTPPSAALDTPPAASQAIENPCTARLSQDARSRPTSATDRRLGKGDGLGTDSRDASDLVWPSRLAARTRLLGANARPAASRDIGDIAVVEDDGTLILQPNPFDLGGVGLRFEPNGAGYDVAPGDAAFRPSLGRELSLGDDDATAAETLPFSFAFYGRQFSQLFVNSDGNLTFEEADTASTERGFARLLGGPPRVAPFFADLDPSAGGRVFVDAAADAFTVTWCRVPGFELPQWVTVQVVLLPQGSVDIRFDAESTLGEGLVALSPGRTDTFAPVDLKQPGRQTGRAGAIGERFVEGRELDLVAASRRFYETHPDAFDQLVFWTDTHVIGDRAFAFETTVQNAIRGIGADTFDAAQEFGSAGALQSLVLMDRVAKYGDDPTAPINGDSSSLEILAHETGHRWLAYLLFSDGRGGAFGPAARPAARTLELLHGLGRVGDGGQRHPGPRRRGVSARSERRVATAGSISMPWGWRAPPKSRRGSTLTTRPTSSPSATARRRLVPAPRSTGPDVTC